MNVEECKNLCLKNCCCTAYSNLGIRDGRSGCLLWFDDLIDIRIINQNERGIFIQMAAPELDNGDGAKVNTKSNLKKRIVVSTMLYAGLFLGLVCLEKEAAEKP